MCHKCGSQQTKLFVAINKKMLWALAGVTQWIECLPENGKVASSIPSQATCLGCGLGSWLGVCNRQPHIDVSLPLFPSSKNK